MVLAWWLVWIGLAVAQAPARPPLAGAVVEVPDRLRQPALPLPSATRDLLRQRKWSEAAAKLATVSLDDLTPPERADLAFLRAWCLVRAGRPAEAAPLLPLFVSGSSAPAPYLAVTRAEVMRAAGDLLGALNAVETVPDDALIHPRASVVASELLRELSRTEEAAAKLEALVARVDPAEGVPFALMARARHLGIGSPAAYPLLRRLWSEYPAAPEAAEATKALERYPDRPATVHEKVVRAERALDAGMVDTALAITGALALDAATEDGCRAVFVKGKAWYKRNSLADAAAAFGDAGAKCPQSAGDYGAKILYLKGQTEYRRGRFAESAAAYQMIADRFPSSSMADDGLSRGGIARQEAGDLPGAMVMWQRALDQHAGGDMAPEATWRLAFAHYLQGQPSEARAVAVRLGEMDPGLDWYHVVAGRYWAARWLVYPDVNDPRRATTDGPALQRAVREWQGLIEAFPQNYYAIIAMARLTELAPEAAKASAVRPDADKGFGAWQVPERLFDSAPVQAGVSLARLGLVNEALLEWGQVDLATAPAEVIAWFAELRIGAGDWLGAHKYGQQWLRTHPVGTLGPREAQVVSVLFPSRYWQEVQDATKGYAYDPRMFHGLVREESSFDKDIVSFAGARGLSQVMPATAREVAGWLGRSVSDAQMFEVSTNLQLGGRYLKSVYGTFKNNPFLSMASYNGGPGRIKGWITAWGNPPLDEYVERIPVKETRDYVKKVSTTWQVMRYAFDRDLPPLPDTSAFNHYALPP